LIAGVGLEQNEKEEETGMERTGIVFQSIGINSVHAGVQVKKKKRI
jgi:hypothetical protein